MAADGSTAETGRKRSVVVRCVIFAIDLYRHTISPMRLPTCRFSPTCSQYAVEALTEYGLIRGGWLAAVRLLKCGPWHRGGWDPVPERRTASHAHGSEDARTADELWDTPALRGESKTRV
jgi:putative membrane protein insertion efficiency factor